MIALRACGSVTTRQFSVLCFFSQNHRNNHFMKDDLVIEDATAIGFSLSAISFSWHSLISGPEIRDPGPSRDLELGTLKLGTLGPWNWDPGTWDLRPWGMGP